MFNSLNSSCAVVCSMARGKWDQGYHPSCRLSFWIVAYIIFFYVKTLIRWRFHKILCKSPFCYLKRYCRFTSSHFSAEKHKHFIYHSKKCLWTSGYISKAFLPNSCHEDNNYRRQLQHHCYISFCRNLFFHSHSIQPGCNDQTCTS